jgi:hypothetical protein
MTFQFVVTKLPRTWTENIEYHWHTRNREYRNVLVKASFLSRIFSGRWSVKAMVPWLSLSPSVHGTWQWEKSVDKQKQTPWPLILCYQTVEEQDRESESCYVLDGPLGQLAGRRRAENELLLKRFYWPREAGQGRARGKSREPPMHEMTVVSLSVSV